MLKDNKTSILNGTLEDFNNRLDKKYKEIKSFVIPSFVKIDNKTINDTKIEEIKNKETNINENVNTDIKNLLQNLKNTKEYEKIEEELGDNKKYTTDLDEISLNIEAKYNNIMNVLNDLVKYSDKIKNNHIDSSYDFKQSFQDIKEAYTDICSILKLLVKHFNDLKFLYNDDKKQFLTLKETILNIDNNLNNFFSYDINKKISNILTNINILKDREELLNIKELSNKNTEYLDLISVKLDKVIDHKAINNNQNKLDQFESKLQNIDNKINFLRVSKEEYNNNIKDLIQKAENKLNLKMDILQDIIKNYEANNKEIFVKNNNMYNQLFENIKRISLVADVNQEKNYIVNIDKKINNIIEYNNDAKQSLKNIDNKIDKIISINQFDDPSILNKIAEEINNINDTNSSILKEHNTFTEKMYSDMKNIKANIMDLVIKEKNNLKKDEIVNKKYDNVYDKNIENKNNILNDNIKSNIMNDQGNLVKRNINKLTNNNVGMALDKLKEALDMDSSNLLSIKSSKDDSNEDERTIDEIIDNMVTKKENIVKNRGLLSDSITDIKKKTISHNVIELSTNQTESKNESKKEEMVNSEKTFVLDNSKFFK